MEEQRIVVFLLEGVRTAKEALGLEKTVTIGGTKYRAVLPVQGRWSSLAAPPVGSEDGEHASRWPNLASGAWGENAPNPVIESIGLILEGATIPPGGVQIEFDHAAAHWRQLLRDWLTVAAEGPTSWAEDYYGATAFPGPGYDGDYDGLDVPYKPVQRGHRHRPRRLSGWAWGHALEHASVGDQPPLARALMTTAIQAAMVANWRVAIIDAATATEAALTVGLVAELSTTLSPSDVAKKLKSNSMLGKRIKLAGNLKMPLPIKIREDLVHPRNAAMHQGAEVTRDQVKAAIKAAWAVVHQYDPLPLVARNPGHRRMSDAERNQAAPRGTSGSFPYRPSRPGQRVAICAPGTALCLPAPATVRSCTRAP